MQHLSLSKPHIIEFFVHFHQQCHFIIVMHSTNNSINFFQCFNIANLFIVHHFVNQVIITLYLFYYAINLSFVLKLTTD